MVLLFKFLCQRKIQRNRTNEQFKKKKLKNKAIYRQNSILGHLHQGDDVMDSVIVSGLYKPTTVYLFPSVLFKSAGLFILTYDNDECSLLNTLLSSFFLFYSHLFFVFVFELLRFDECYAINLPYFII